MPFLFKYMPSVYANSDNFLNQVIEHNSLWFSNPWRFDDLLDCNPKISIDGFTKEKHREIFIRAAKSIQPQKGKALLQNISMIDAPNWPEVHEKLIQDNLHKTLSKMGILCLTKSSMNRRMWEEYAGNQTGVCLAFDPGVKCRAFRHGRAVVYDDSQLTFSQLEIEDAERYVTRKGTKYSFEEEIRFISEAEGLVEFDKQSLKMVIFGLHMKHQQRRHIESLLNGRGYEHVQIAEIVRNDYSSKAAFKKWERGRRSRG